VLEYWLDHAEGFEIRYRRRSRGHVESVLVDSQSGRAERLVVRSPVLGRTRVIPADSIVAVEPFAHILVHRLERSPLVRLGRATNRSAIGLGAAGRRSALWLGPRTRNGVSAAGRGMRHVGVWIVAAAAWVAPRTWAAMKAASAWAAAATRRARRLVAESSAAARAWLQPRLSNLARAMASATRSGARVLVRESRAVLAWLRPRLSAAGTSPLGNASAAAAWLGPRLRATFDDAGTGTPSLWHLPHPDPPRSAASDRASLALERRRYQAGARKGASGR
jgi:hypothetical protein